MLLDSLDPERLTFRLDLVNPYSPPRIPAPPTQICSRVRSFRISCSPACAIPIGWCRPPALDLTRKQERLRSLPAIHAAISELTTSPVRRTQLVGRAIQGGREPEPLPETVLDFDFFRERIQPILQAPGLDGRSCTVCHASNARFPLRGDARANFIAAARKVNLLNPVESPILVKPLLPNVTADGDIFRTAHNGGQRWPARTGSSEYQLILEWIRGERLNGSKLIVTFRPVHTL